MVWVEGADKPVHFGAAGYSDFTIHNDVDRRARYIARHGRGRENWEDIYTAGFWSRWLTWNKPTLEASKKDIAKRFGVKWVKKL